jgi:hypothetical protein
MKRCPKCNLEYDDNTLEFCLEDGSRLFSEHGKTLPQTVVMPRSTLDATIETAGLHNQNIPKTVDMSNVKSTVQEKGQVLKQTVVHQSFKVLEILPIIISLAHNYWQWLYVNNQPSSDIMSFIISVHFLVWLILLIAGAILSIVAIKYCQNKGFAYTSLVILAINFILFLVPRR